MSHWECRFDEAETAFQHQQWQQARELFRSLMRDRLNSRFPLDAIDYVVLERNAELGAMFRQFDATDALLSAAALAHAENHRIAQSEYLTLKRVEALLIPGHLGQAFDVLCSLQCRLGALADVPYTSEMLPDWEECIPWPMGSIPELFLVRFYLCLGQYLSARGQYGHAAVLLLRGRSIALDGDQELVTNAEVPTTLGLAQALLEMGCLDDAGAALDCVQGRFLPEAHPGWDVWRNELAGTHALLAGNLGRAAAPFRAILQRCAEDRFPMAVLAARLNLAELLLSLNQTVEPDEHLDAAEALLGTLSDAAYTERVQWLRRLASARGDVPLGRRGISVSEHWQHETLGAHSQSSPDFDPVVLDPPSNFLARFNDCAHAVLWALDRGEMDTARERLDSMRLEFGQSDSELIALKLKGLEGAIAYANQAYTEAEVIFADAESLAEQLRLRSELLRIRRFRAWCAERLGLPEAEILRRSRAVLDVMDGLVNGLSGGERAVWMFNNASDEERFLALEARELETYPLGAHLQERLHSFLNRVDRHRRREAYRTTCGASSEPQPGPTLSERLRRSEHCEELSLVVLPEFTVVVYAVQGTLRIRCRPLPRDRAHEHVSRWHHAARSNLLREYPTRQEREKIEEELTGAAEELATLLGFEELLRVDGSSEPQRLRIVPDGPLHGFPFAALPFQGRPLIESFALTIGFESGMGPPVEPPAPTLPGFALGVPDGCEEWNLAPLRKAEPEAEWVATWAQGHALDVRPTSAAGADVESVSASLVESAFAHVSCHGIFVPARPDQSGLILIPKQGLCQTLSVRVLSGLDLGRLRHVTLSSCWAADSFVLPDRRTVSVPEILWRAGVPSVLACLWPVRDRFSVLFMERFYTLLESKDADIALRQVQIECQQGTLPGANVLSKQVTAWAGFRICGVGLRRWPRPQE